MKKSVIQGWAKDLLRQRKLSWREALSLAAF